MALNLGQFYMFHGLFRPNELNASSINPLSLVPGSQRRALTDAEQEDYQKMQSRAPKIHQAPIPTEGPNHPDVTDIQDAEYLRVKYVAVRKANGRVECYAMGMKFYSIRQCKDFIHRYNVAATRPRVMSLLQGRRNKVLRRQRAHKICVKAALEQYYDSRAPNGTTTKAMRRRGLIQKICV